MSFSPELQQMLDRQNEIGQQLTVLYASFGRKCFTHIEAKLPYPEIEKIYKGVADEILSLSEEFTEIAIQVSHDSEWIEYHIKNPVEGHWEESESDLPF